MGLFGRSSKDDPDAVRLFASQAAEKLSAQGPAAALPDLRKALDLCSKVLGDCADTAVARVNLVEGLRQAGVRPDEAYSQMKRAVSDFIRLLGEQHPRTVRDRLDFGLQCATSGRHTEAIGHLGAVVSVMEQQGTGSPEPLTTARAFLADAYMATGDHAHAIPLLERVAADQERVLGPDAEDTLTALDALGAGYRQAGRRGEAVRLLERELTGLERVLGTQHPKTEQARGHLAYLYVEMGRESEVEGLLTRGPVPSLDEAGIHVTEDGRA